MAPIQKVVLAGASGTVGAPVLEALLEAKLDVTVFTRPESTTSFPPSVKVVKVSYDDVQGLTEALKGQDAVVSTITSSAVGTQKPLLDAAIAAGVKRVIPSEFGSNTVAPKTRAFPVFGSKVEIQEYLEQKTKGNATTYTFVITNVFLDWGLSSGFLIDVKNKKLELLDGGDKPFTSTPLAFIGKGVAQILLHPNETANRVVYLHGAKVTQKQLLTIAQRVVGADGWTITEASTEALEKEAYKNFKENPANVSGWIFSFLKRAVIAHGYGGDFSAENDNGVLGLEELTEPDIEEYVRQAAK